MLYTFFFCFNWLFRADSPQHIIYLKFPAVISFFRFLCALDFRQLVPIISSKLKHQPDLQIGFFWHFPLWTVSILKPFFESADLLF